MEKSTQMGANRTGVDISPIQSEAMVNGADQYSPKAGDGNRALAAIQSQYISASGSVGSVPVPGTMKGTLKSTMNKLAGRNPEVFLNKLGERLAYERSGVRLYESFIRKCEALNGSTMSPLPMDELREICNEEAEHFHLLKECMKTLGADPTAQTPDADVSGVASSGMIKVVSDPRTSISQCLEVLLSVELTDNAAWELLINLSEHMGLDDMTKQFQHALQQEKSHEQRVKAWYQQAVSTQVEKSEDTAH